MARKTLKVPMYHPWRKDEYGNPAIQHINPATVRSGKAAVMGYLPVPVPEAPPKPPVATSPVNQKGVKNAD
jgi:hypothetical protein